MKIALEKIIPEIHTITCGIYYKQLQELLNSILNRPVDKRKKDIILCKEGIYRQCKKIAYFSYPYSKIQYYGIETAGFMDIDSELILTFSNGHILQFDFKSNVDIRMINSLISKYVL